MEFIIPLAITLMVGVAIVLLVVGLFSAPWPILLFLLLLVLIGTRRTIQSNFWQSGLEKVDSSRIEPVAALESNKNRVLIYRGATFWQSELKKVDSSQIEPVAALESNKNRVLIYRGVTFEKPPLLSKTVTQASQTEISKKHRENVWTLTQKLFAKKT